MTQAVHGSRVSTSGTALRVSSGDGAAEGATALSMAMEPLLGATAADAAPRPPVRFTCSRNSKLEGAMLSKHLFPRTSARESRYDWQLAA